MYTLGCLAQFASALDGFDSYLGFGYMYIYIYIYVYIYIYTYVY